MKRSRKIRELAKSFFSEPHAIVPKRYELLQLSNLSDRSTTGRFTHLNFTEYNPDMKAATKRILRTTTEDFCSFQDLHLRG